MQEGYVTTTQSRSLERIVHLAGAQLLTDANVRAEASRAKLLPEH